MIEHKFTNAQSYALFQQGMNEVNAADYAELEALRQRADDVVFDTTRSSHQREAAQLLRVEIIGKQNSMVPQSVDPTHWTNEQQKAAVKAKLDEANEALRKNPGSEYWERQAHGYKSVQQAADGEEVEPYFANDEEKARYERNADRSDVRHLKGDDDDATTVR